MKRIIKNTLLIISPFLIVIMVNEMVRSFNHGKSYAQHGVNVINSDKMDEAHCTWVCHNHTSYCLSNHVKLSRQCLNYTNTIYFGAIKALAATGNYAIANIAVFVILFPVIIFILLIKCIAIKKQIKLLELNKEIKNVC